MVTEARLAVIEPLRLPSPKDIRVHVLDSLSRFWRRDATPIASLPVCPKEPGSPVKGPLRLNAVQLPEWAISSAINGRLLIPSEVKPNSVKDKGQIWQAVDWFLAAFLLLECWHERVWEQAHGPIHSYSFRLEGWDERAWQHAWVNRIGLFLRLWAIQRQGAVAEGQMGPLPAAEIQMTHDVDAVTKTLPIRLKQGAFNLFNAARCLCTGHAREAGNRLGQVSRFLIGTKNWWTFDTLLAAEEAAGIKAIYHFHADQRPKTLKRWLFDPGYDITAPRQCGLLHKLIQTGHQIGLHPGLETWQSPAAIAEQRKCLEKAAGCTVACCRQHWLRFSWKDTWAAQSAAGLLHDRTLMFNDRPGFRNSAALTWRPWQPESNSQHSLTAQPTVLMDSHCYDYQPLSQEDRRRQIKAWIGECHVVFGQAAVLWHPHTLTGDYGWFGGFEDTLFAMQGHMS